MKLLLDTHICLWLGSEPERISPVTLAALGDRSNELFYSVVSLWEIGVKKKLKRTDFTVDPRIVRLQLQANEMTELVVAADHVLAVEHLPQFHRDPFDRLLICQAMTEGMTIVTGDRKVLQYDVAQLKA